MATTTWTTLGTLGGTGSARVDGAGRVEATDRSWAFAWTIGAEDRWHDPADTANVRQACLGETPVVETRMRVPGGDIVHRAFAMFVAGADGGSEWVVVEVENDSGVPVALAVSDPASAQVVLPRPPSDRRDEGELVFTLTHLATIRFLIGLTPDSDLQPDPGDLPSADVVLSGWRTQLDRGARIVVPDERMQQAIDTTRAHLIVDSSRSVSPALATVLDDVGLHGDARSVVARLVEFRFDTRRGSFGDLGSNTAVVAAVARHQELAPDRDFAVTVVDRFVAGVQQLLDATRPRRFRGRPASPTPELVAALTSAVGFLEAAGEPDAAATVTAALSDLATILGTPQQELSQDRAIEVVDEMISTASPTWTWTNPEGTDRSVGESVRFLDHVRRALVEERPDSLGLLPDVPRRWFGQSVEAHDVPTRFGPLSFAVRWHGERPALLWELDVTGASSTVRLSCGLDPAWSTTEPSGETLLAAPDGDSDDRVVDGPGAGDSFG